MDKKLIVMLLALATVVAAGTSVVALSSCGGTAEGTIRELGDTTSKDAVIGALKSTGYQLRYRKVPRLEEYEIVSGEAIYHRHRIQFTVEIKLSGPYEQRGKRYVPNPQPPVLRYEGYGGGTVVGNIWYGTANDSPNYVGRGFELESNKLETTMAVHLGVALEALFASKYRSVA